MTHKTLMAPVDSDLKPQVFCSLFLILYETTIKHVREPRRGQSLSPSSLAVGGNWQAQYPRFGKD
jgi:hypothetical protein